MTVHVPTEVLVVLVFLSAWGAFRGALDVRDAMRRSPWWSA